MTTKPTTLREAWEACRGAAATIAEETEHVVVGASSYEPFYDTDSTLRKAAAAIHALEPPADLGAAVVLPQEMREALRRCMDDSYAVRDGDTQARADLATLAPLLEEGAEPWAQGAEVGARVCANCREPMPDLCTECDGGGR